MEVNAIDMSISTRAFFDKVCYEKKKKNSFQKFKIRKNMNRLMIC